jgi:TonB-linked SusC/RagA family outer membrane protein
MRFICHLLITSSLLLCFTFIAQAQLKTGEITGIVKDAEIGDYLPGTTIVLKTTAIGAAADVDGSYLIPKVPVRGSVINKQNKLLLASNKKSVAMVMEEVISGKITDEETGEPLPGATVLVKGTNIGTVTDTEGSFRLEIPEGAESLLVSFVGYIEQEVVLAGQTEFQIEMVSGGSELDEVIVIGYGTQKKVNSTGAVSQVQGESIESRPITNVGQALQGLVPNLNITFNDGTPGGGANFNIRGITSINGGEPLILIDGVPGDPTLINPRDIESVSVLKDAASSAIYGARGAYGVILINTKNPENQVPKVTYNGNIAFSKPTILPEVVTDPYVSMKLMNDARVGWDGNNPFSQENLDYAQQRSQNLSLPETKIIETSGGDRYLYAGNTDWIDEMYEDIQPMHQHNLAISGGSDNISYFISGGYLNQQGVFKYDADQFERYNFRAKVDAKITDWLSVNNNLMYNRGETDFPSFWGNSVDIWRYIAVLGRPEYPLKNPDGTWSSGGRFIGFLKEGGRSVKEENLLQNTIGADLSLLNDKLRVIGKYTFQTDGYRQNTRIKPLSNVSTIPGSTFDWGANRVEETNTDNFYHVINAYAEYEEVVDKHAFKGMIGYNQELRRFNRNYVQREDLVSDELNAIGLAVGDTQLSSDAYEWAIRGVFFRFNYSFDDKYLLEINGRFDGTSRFPQEERFGFFPSASAGWRISEEAFFEPLKKGVSEWKIRASYGSLGNQNLVGNYYPYIPTMATFTSPVIINDAKPLAISAPGLISPSLTWETATTYDIGTDIGFLQNQLNLTVDYYIRETSNMLTKSMTLPAVLGTGEPLENAADLRTKGWELSLNYDDELQVMGKEMSFNVGVVFSDYTAEITRFDNPNNFLGDFYEGQRFGEIWGFNTLGFFQSESEIESHADQSVLMRQPDKIAPGDLKFEDRNGDGVIDYGENTLENPGDRFVIGNSEPRYSYGVTANVNWNNFSFSAFFQGIGQRDFYPRRETSYFWSVYNRWYNTPFENIVDNYWTPENPDAYFPRLKAYIALSNDRELDAEQTRYLQDASYMRLKNLTIGYTIPREVTRKIGFENVRFYFSGENLWETTDLKVPVDPEALTRSHVWGDGSTYPFTRSYSFGLDVTF